MSSPTRIVLVIEPRPSERSGVCELVSCLGYLCIEACDGSEAQSQLVQTRPDVILLSEALPGEGAFELLEDWARDEDCRNIPVLMLSSASDRESLRRALDQGVSDFVRMPPESAELEARLRSALRLLALKEEMERTSDRDRLTGLPNRRAFMACFRREIERVTRHGGELGFAVLDLDHFNSVNELHGRDVGDEVLASIARGLESRVRAPDLVARWGGGSFAILLPETGLDEATRTLDRLRCALRERPSSRSVPGLCVSFSAGVAELDPLNGLSEVHHLLKAADAALARAKRAGRDKVVLTREAI
jgi:diguanylate cyclase (GGDEF)-like protein